MIQLRAFRRIWLQKNLDLLQNHRRRYIYIYLQACWATFCAQMLLECKCWSLWEGTNNLPWGERWLEVRVRQSNPDELAFYNDHTTESIDERSTCNLPLNLHITYKIKINSNSTTPSSNPPLTTPTNQKNIYTKLKTHSWVTRPQH